MDFDNTTPYDALCEKWDPLLEHEALPRIEDSYKKKVTSVLLENQEKALREQYLAEAGPANQMGGNFSDPQVGSAGKLAGYDPVLISLVRRAMPNLMAYDIAGVQPMSAPTGLIFAMRARYTEQAAAGSGVGQNVHVDSGAAQEALFQEAQTKFGGSGNTSSGAAFSATGGVNPSGITGAFAGGSFAADPRATTSPLANTMRGMLTGTAELLGATDQSNFQQMAFNIDRVAVEARSRALKAEYTTELAQDLKAVHGLDAETELANILSTEILSEINRELVRSIYYNAELGCGQKDLAGAGGGAGVAGLTAAGGIYDLNTDSDGRWSAERFRGLMYQIEREANVIAKTTRRGKGNFIICSSDVASALAMGGFLNISPALNTQLDVDDTGNTFAGVLNGKMRVYIDPYSTTAGTDFVCVGYKGASPYDAGMFYCPYVPLQMVRAVGQDTFQPKIGFKTRYGMVNNPFARQDGSGEVFNTSPGGNLYYRLFGVTNLHGNQGTT
tara:strand:- start:310 stop:1809 length:1500 start_codon:yes stop_codon:yes gene_type:complete